MFVRSVYEHERCDYGVFMKWCVYGPWTRIPKVVCYGIKTHICVYAVFMNFKLCLWCVYEMVLSVITVCLSFIGHIFLQSHF